MNSNILEKGAASTFVVEASRERVQWDYICKF